MNTSATHRALCQTAWMAGVFCALVCGIMLYEHFIAASNDPWKSPELIALKNKLIDSPKDAALQEQIRQMDLKFRERFRRRIALDKTGAWLLAGGALTLVLAVGKAAALRAMLPLPQPKPDAAEASARAAARARWAVAGVGFALVCALWIVQLDTASAGRSSPGGEAPPSLQPKEASAPAESPPTLEEMKANWPRFRGWDGSGVAAQGATPTDWGTNGQLSILWRAPLPAPGHSSPVIWGSRVFLSGGTADRRVVFCIDASNGTLLWQRAIENIPGSPPKMTDFQEDTGCASPTMATDGRRVYVIFANGDLAALDFNGSVVWTKYFGPFKNSYGYANSLAIWGTDLIVQLDQGESDPAGSKLVSLQGATGRPNWERARVVPASWSSPIVFAANGKTQILTLGNPWAVSYDVAGGNEIWRASLLEGEVVPSPIFAGGRIILANPGNRLMALRPDGLGDVTNTMTVWGSDDGVPDISSPVSDGELVFTATSPGTVTCFDAAAGKKLWSKELDMEVQASPGIMGGRLFVAGKDGVVVMLQTARVFQEIGRTTLPDKFRASPAFAGGHLFLRGETNLYSLGPGKASPAQTP